MQLVLMLLIMVKRAINSIKQTRDKVDKNRGAP